MLELAADGVDVSGCLPAGPDRVRGDPEAAPVRWVARTCAQHPKSTFALRAAAMVRAGVDPGLLNEVSRWRTDDVLYGSLEALVTYVRLVSERAGQSVESVCRRIA